MGWRDWLRRPPRSDLADRIVSGDFREQLSEVGLTVWVDQLLALDRESVRLRPQPVADPETIAIGGSRLGGEPDLPAATPWPEWRGMPLSFIAQVELGEMPGLSDQPLPTAGLLSFFYDAKQDVWGYDPAHLGAWRVLWSEPGDVLERRATPGTVPRDARYRPTPLAGTVEITHVGWDSAEIESLGMSSDELSSYVEIVEHDRAPIHRLLGHPEPIQNDMQLECQLVSHGLYCGDSSGYDDPRSIELGPGAVDWRLLLQVDSNDDAGMMWGDAGRLYFWMTKAAMERRDWASAWMILQCG